MCWVEKSIYLWQRERERLFVSLQKQKNSKLGQGRRLEARKPLDGWFFLQRKLQNICNMLTMERVTVEMIRQWVN